MTDNEMDSRTDKKELARQTGTLIRRLRLAKNYTQEELAEGICAISTLSRVENGSHMPSREVFLRLMERLGIAGESLSGVYSPREIMQNTLKKELIDALENGQLNESSQWLWILRQLVVSDDTAGRQYLEMIDILLRNIEHERVQAMQEADMPSEIRWQNETIRLCLEAIRLTLPQFQPDQPIANLPLTRVEMILINNLGLACMCAGRYHSAVRIMSGLEGRLARESRQNAVLDRPLAVVRNNLAVCIAHMALYDEALIWINQAIQNIRLNGSVNIVAKLLHTRMLIFSSMKNMDAYYQDYHALLAIAGIFPTDEGSRARVTRLLRQNPGIRVL